MKKIPTIWQTLFINFRWIFKKTKRTYISDNQNNFQQSTYWQKMYEMGQLEYYKTYKEYYG